MNNNISNVVRRTLRERYEINQKFLLIRENEELSDKEKFDKVLDTLSDLEDQGISDEEIDSSLDEGFGDWLKKLALPGNDQTSSQTGINPGIGDFGQKMGSAFASQIREYLLSYGLRLLGFKGKLKEAFAASMADLSIRQLVTFFRGGTDCESAGAPVVDAIVEGLAAYLVYDIEEDSWVGTSLRQIASEYFKASPLGEKFAGVICQAMGRK